MTTIATDGKSMAGDSLVTAKGELLGTKRKVERTKDGRIFGATGLSADCARFARWMHGGEKPELDDDFRALVLTPQGQVLFYCDKLEPVEYLAPMGIGSGGDFALGAMLAGKSPKEAVEIAAMRDMATGGDITVEVL